MERLLKGLSPDGEALLNLIPGGVMQCRNDAGYTICLLYTSDAADEL